MNAVYLDYETFNELDIRKVGMYKYVAHPSLEPILLSYKCITELDGKIIAQQPVVTLDLISNPMLPKELLGWLDDPTIIKRAWNAAFEFAVTKNYYVSLKDITFDSWECTMSKSAYNGYPLGLATASKVFKLKNSKLAGKLLIKTFCSPRKATKTNPSLRNWPKDNPDKWEEFKTYNSIDVEAEFEADQLLRPLPSREQRIFQMDHKINSLGIRFDKPFVKALMKLNSTYSRQLKEKTIEITGLDNPNSTSQLKEWLVNATGTSIANLQAATIAALLDNCDNEEIKEVLTYRQDASLSSVKKYNAMLNCENNDVIKGLFQYYGALRTGRWAGRLVQLHNQPRQAEKLVSLQILREAVRSGADANVIELLYGSPLQLSKELLRTSFIPRPGNKFIIADYSAIEAVVIAAYAQEEWRLEVFRTHGKIYEASIAQMLGIPLTAVTEELRQKGKVAELSLGFQGSVGALVRMGALKMGLKGKELPGLVWHWRKASPNICRFWYQAEESACLALANPGKRVTFQRGLLAFLKRPDTLELQLPSGRSLFYPGAYRSESGTIYYFGPDQQSGNWGRRDLYGGKIVENIVQATARDLLAEGALRIDSILDLPLPLHVHDELVFEAPAEDAEELCRVVEKLMTRPPYWMKDIPLRVKSIVTDFYCKG